MERGICIEHSGASSLAGTRQKIVKVRITLGRHADNDVVFDAERDRLVSARHAEIVARADGLELRDLDSSNGTFVNGRRIDRTSHVTGDDVITLGPNGPTLRVEPAAPANVRRAEDRGTRARIRAGSGKNSIGIHTMMQAIESSVGRERRRAGKLAASAAAAVLVISLAAWRSASATNSELEMTREKLAEQSSLAAEGSFDGIDDRLRGSVYFVTRQRRSGDQWIDMSGGGTAWHVRNGVVATNAHVAETHDALTSGTQRLVCRVFHDGEVAELIVARTEVHPAYAAFSQLVSRLHPFDAGQGFLRVPPAWDVALMHVREEDRRFMGEPLELADEEALRDLSSGDPLCYLGFPSEGVTGGGFDRARPVSTFRAGRLSKLQDFFLSPGDFADMHLLTVSVDAAGGASGSPIVDSRGRVVALLNSGDVLAATSSGRITGDNTYGMRVDVLRELLDGNATERLASRLPRWKELLEARWLKGREAFLEQAAADYVRPRLPEGRRFGVRAPIRRSVRLSGAGTANGQVARIGALTAGAYVITAVPRSRPITLGIERTAYLRGRRDVELSEVTSWHPTLKVEPDGVLTIDVRVFAADDEIIAGEDIDILVWPIEIR